MTNESHSACRLVEYFTAVLKSHDIIRLGHTDYKLKFDCKPDAQIFADRHDLKVIAVNPYGFIVAGR